MDLSNYATVMPIVIVCYLVGQLCKAIHTLPNRFIPVIVGTTGGILAIPAMYIIPNFPATDVITAISVGIFSGFASTGVNQVYKQILKKS